MNYPMTALGSGFINAIGRRYNASSALFSVNPANGMPIVVVKPTIVEKSKRKK